NHADPVCGGRTAVENLHFLCWFHHAMKTAGKLDPIRVEADESPAGTAGTVWEMQERFRVFREDDTDLLTPQAVAQLDAVWDSMQRRQDDFEQRRDTEAGASGEAPSPDPSQLNSPWPIRPGPPDPWPRVDMDQAGAPDLEEVPVEKPVRRRYQPLPTFQYDGDIPISATTRKPRKQQNPPPKFDPGPPPF
ncbi:HNH endonuclease signature motif containing protein, partial [Brachybacterium halotolerans]|uniref:HNH endonuclease signature motif containing protein n=1 Tax=Brachybacterium halotolerans TaxID=2795215 RepID=UPI001BE3DBE2